MGDTVSEKETISLIIKTPNQTHGDQLVEDVDINWTVKELKTYLTSIYPSKPAEKDQRLIYFGKLLLDHMHLRDVITQLFVISDKGGDHIADLDQVLNSGRNSGAIMLISPTITDTVPTLHLVCAFKPQPGSMQEDRPKVRPAEQQPSTAQTRLHSTDTTSPGPSVPTVPSNAGLRQRVRSAPASPAAPWPGTNADTNTTMPNQAAVTHPAFPTYSLYSPQQILWLQHMYARQYYMQYHAAMAATASSPVPPSTSLPITPQQAAVPAALPNQAPIDNLPANQNAPDPAFINPEGANQNMRMNAQGGPVVEDEDDVERDWLDWVYTASRFAVFLSIVYFYSSLSRFILVMASLLLMYLHTVGWFPFRRRAQPRLPNQPAAEVIQNQQNQNQDRQPQVVPPVEVEDGEIEEEAVQAPPMIAVPVSAVRPPILWTAWVFFKAFFASLIPEAPGAMAN